MNRSQDGRAQVIEIIGPQTDSQTLSGNNFRMIVNRAFGSDELKSTLFQMASSGADYVFRGNGFGHGVGLNQWGAHEMSKRGATFDQILAFYYPNTVIEPFTDTRQRFITYNNSNYGYGVRNQEAGVTPTYQDDRYTYSQSVSEKGGTVSYSDDAWIDDEYEQGNYQPDWSGASEERSTASSQTERIGNWFTRLFPRNRNNEESSEPDLPIDTQPSATGGSSDKISQLIGEGGNAGTSTRISSQSGGNSAGNNMKGWSSTKGKSGSDPSAQSASKRKKRTKRIGW